MSEAYSNKMIQLRTLGLLVMLSVLVACAFSFRGQAVQSHTRVSAGPAAIQVLGSIEEVHLGGVDFPLDARVDTGADLSSLDARNIQEFTKDNKPWVCFQVCNRQSGHSVEIKLPVTGFVKIKRHGQESQCRPVVTLPMMLGDKKVNTDFTLVNRSNFRQPILIGRSYLDGRALVDVSQKYLASAPR
ncbi:ATP-dependent zinc protease [Parendozoicomonas haliclonae]|uniref:Retropepsin-like aspartic endopeptidase domain-containing protein n=1 Tax=Parendozoicomonas haliclonae TaxID=1960125 RepID=A0A1X7AF30_9GAMM|nr:RimK/LysX family protein [Parendozoicomonas haliclonae]SMA36290.1 hypothetical protein EHSB41UT_00618 [Parendozoicomonas haliclonae]